MGFEQLAELKKQLAAARGEAAPAARSGAKPASKDARPAAKDASKPGARPARKPAPPRRAAPAAESGAKPAVEAKPVDPVVKSIGRLQKRFPIAFPKNPAPKLPLKVGIFEDLVAHAKDLSLSEAELRDAIKTWCRGSRYWKSLVEGAARVDLTGAEAGKVTAQEAAGAQRLQAHRAGKGAPKAASGTGNASATATAGAATEGGAQAAGGAENAPGGQQAAHQPAQATAQDSAHQPAQATAQDSAHQPAQETARDPAQENAPDSAQGTAHEATAEPLSAPATREA